MDTTMTLIVMGIMSTVIALLVKAVWAWAGNKNGKRDIELLEKKYDEKLKGINENFTKLEVLYTNRINDFKEDFNKKLTDKFIYVKEIKDSIDDQRKEFAELKELIMSSYVTKGSFDSQGRRFEDVRDTTLKNENNIKIIKDSVKQNVDRMFHLENKK